MTREEHVKMHVVFAHHDVATIHDREKSSRSAVFNYTYSDLHRYVRLLPPLYDPAD